MLITNKTRYAALALFDLASQASSEHISLAELSNRYGISVSYLEQIFMRLRAHGLVTSARGPGGGYRLAHPANIIRLADILTLFDKDDAGDPGAPTPGSDIPQRMWQQLDDRMRAFLATLTLADLLPSGQSASLKSATGPKHLAPASVT